MQTPDTHLQWTHVGVRVPRELALRFARIAADADRTVSAELRRLIRTHVDEAAREAGATGVT